MKKFIGACSVCLIVFVFTDGPVRAEHIETLEFGLNASYRLDDLDWNIAGTLAGTNPNVLSELSWQDLKIHQLGVSGKLAVSNKFVDYFTYIRGSFDYGWVKGGDWRDSDFYGDNRSIEYSRSIGVAEDDYVLDASLGLGFQWKFWRKRLAIAPLGGYSYHEQHLRNTQGFQEIPLLGSFQGLNETYETVWQGPWAGIDLEWDPVSSLSLLGTFEYHWADYDAEADWNLRSTLAHPTSFIHEADDARGIVVRVTGRYLFAGIWALDLSWSYQDWQAEDGTDTTFFATGGSTFTRLNEVNWNSSALTLGLSFKFI